MKNLKFLSIAIIAVLFTACGEITTTPNLPKTGVEEVTADVPLQSNGRTVEQDNIVNRLKADNMPGSIKHLYLISAYSGDVIMYSTVKGKVTSSGKRLSPTEQVVQLEATANTRYNPDLIQDDGTYGSSVEYIYWWDSKGIYHQQYITGGMILHISSEPIAVNKVILNLETR